MQIRNKNKAFTLIEIIVVLIILGVLSALALPSLFSNIKSSRAAGALAAIHGFRSTVDGCIYKYSPNHNDSSYSTALVKNNCGVITFISDPSAGWRYDFSPDGATYLGPGSDANDAYDYSIFAHATNALTSFNWNFLVTDAYAVEADPSNYIPLMHAELGSIDNTEPPTSSTNKTDICSGHCLQVTTTGFVFKNF